MQVSFTVFGLIYQALYPNTYVQNIHKNVYRNKDDHNLD